MAKLDNFDGLMDFLEGFDKYNGYVKVATLEAAKECVRMLRAKSRLMFGDGPYCRGWKYQKTAYGYTVYNKEYQLVHLLEKGHAVVDRNGVSHGAVAGRPHVEPVRGDTEKVYMRLLEEGIDRIL